MRRSAQAVLLIMPYVCCLPAAAEGMHHLLRALPADCASHMLVPQVLRMSSNLARHMGFLLGCCTTNAASCCVWPSQYPSKDTLAWLRVNCIRWLAKRSMDRQPLVRLVSRVCRGSRRIRPRLRPCLWPPSTVEASGGSSARHLMAAQKACSEVPLLVSWPPMALVAAVGE